VWSPIEVARMSHCMFRLLSHWVWIVTRTCTSFGPFLVLCVVSVTPLLCVLGTFWPGGSARMYASHRLPASVLIQVHLLHHPSQFVTNSGVNVSAGISLLCGTVDGSTSVEGYDFLQRFQKHNSS